MRCYSNTICLRLTLIICGPDLRWCPVLANIYFAAPDITIMELNNTSSQ
jgi:hypothetical protein